VHSFRPIFQVFGIIKSKKLLWAGYRADEDNKLNTKCWLRNSCKTDHLEVYGGKGWKKFKN
jgi:hypothetical protein